MSIALSQRLLVLASLLSLCGVGLASEGNADPVCYSPEFLCIDKQAVARGGRVVAGIRNVSIGCSGSRMAKTEYEFQPHSEVRLFVRLIDNDSECAIRTIGGAIQHSVFCEECAWLREATVTPDPSVIGMVRPSSFMNYSTGTASATANPENTKQ
ncbi:MAG: hypothetical protein AAF358_10285 [Pseudomonadota bacterium]